MNSDQYNSLLTRLQNLPTAQRPPEAVAVDHLLGSMTITSPQRRGQPYQLHAQQWLPTSIDQVFSYFSDAMNLEELTPSLLNFKVLTPPPIDMFPGQLIDYRLKVRGIPMRWQSEITCWEPPHRFIDVQKHGPYKLWHHEHRFEPHPEGGTLCIDDVQFLAPGPKVATRWLVIPDLKQIFNYRQCKLRDHFAPALAAAIDDRWPEDCRAMREQAKKAGKADGMMPGGSGVPA